MNFMRKLPLEVLDEAIALYAEQNGGRGPNTTSGSAEKYLGVRYDWKSLNAMLHQHYGSSLRLRAQHLGVRTQAVNENMTLPRVEDAMRAYAREHGRFPNQNSGDATPYLGIKKRWSGVDSHLRILGTSLFKQSQLLSSR